MGRERTSIRKSTDKGIQWDFRIKKKNIRSIRAGDVAQRWNTLASHAKEVQHCCQSLTLPTNNKNIKRGKREHDVTLIN
jgi:hypothetical protein